jgi:hypothetical protein
VRLLVDANLAPKVADALIEAGHDAVHVFAIGLAEASDDARAEVAEADGARDRVQGHRLWGVARPPGPLDAVVRTAFDTSTTSLLMSRPTC